MSHSGAWCGHRQRLRKPGSDSTLEGPTHYLLGHSAESVWWAAGATLGNWVVRGVLASAYARNNAGLEEDQGWGRAEILGLQDTRTSSDYLVGEGKGGEWQE